MGEFLTVHAFEILWAGIALFVGFVLGLCVAILGYGWHEKASTIDALEAMGFIERVEDADKNAE